MYMYSDTLQLHWANKTHLVIHFQMIQMDVTKHAEGFKNEFGFRRKTLLFTRLNKLNTKYWYAVETYPNTTVSHLFKLQLRSLR